MVSLVEPAPPQPLGVHLQALGLSSQGVPVHVEEIGRGAQLALVSFERLSEHRPVHLVHQNPIELWHFPTVKLIEELPESEVEELFEGQLEGIHRRLMLARKKGARLSQGARPRSIEVAQLFALC